ncbi:kinase-like protein, partial [Setomelanomma holmii]
DVQMRICTQTASALAYLHQKQETVHRDVKPHNILLSEDHLTVKVCDFGTAQPLSKRDRGGGTHNYIAPEFLLQGTRTAASDIWSLGVTM